MKNLQKVISFFGNDGEGFRAILKRFLEVPQCFLRFRQVTKSNMKKHNETSRNLK